MRIASHTTWIARRPEEVFDFFVDFAQAPRWRSYVTSMRRLDDGPIGPGSRVAVAMDVMGSRYEFELHVLVCERPSLWRHRTTEQHYRGHIEYRFEPENGGTRVTLTIVARPRGLYGWLGMPLMLLQRNRPYAEQLPKLKQALEQP
jgi:uncharacterized protein YndB with AHSA1/START domain